MIIKIQRPLMTNGDEPMALIYNQDRSINSFVPYSMVEHLFAVPDGEEQPLKIYHKMTIEFGLPALEERVEDQDW